MLAKPFVTSLRQALTGGGDHRSFGVPYDGSEGDRMSIMQLDDFARRQWDSILYFVVGSVEAGGDMNSTIAPGSRELLKVGKFVNFNGKHASITQEGFEFLLRDINTQVWSLLIVYLNQGQLVSLVAANCQSCINLRRTARYGLNRNIVIPLHSRQP